MGDVWRPGTKTAKRIANALLREYRAGRLPEEAPAWIATSCISAMTIDRLSPGARAQLGRLWRQYGSREMMQGVPADIREELGAVLAATA